mgnify:CR=1 FL=1
MKKNGRKARRLAKEKQAGRLVAEAQAGEPFSRASKRKRLCTHYHTIGGGFTVGIAQSYLQPISESKCCCLVCKTEFSMEQYRAMEAFVNGYSGQGCTTVAQAHAYIQKIVPPVLYCKLDANTVKTFPLEEDTVALPNNCIAIY